MQPADVYPHLEALIETRFPVADGPEEPDAPFDPSRYPYVALYVATRLYGTRAALTANRWSVDVRTVTVGLDREQTAAVQSDLQMLIAEFPAVIPHASHIEHRQSQAPAPDPDLPGRTRWFATDNWTFTKH